MYEITTLDGRKLKRISRWITVRHDYNPTKRSPLWDYVCDADGYHPYSKQFNPSEGLYLDWFEHKKKKYAVDQFYVIGSAWVGGVPLMYDDADGKTCVIGSMYMDGPLFGPTLYGEWDDCCEHVRLYESA